jgi:cytochrome P450
MRERAGGEFIASEKETSYRRDFLSRFIEARQKNPEFVTPDRVVSMTISNIFAGFDTTAISLRAIFYYLLKNPSDMAILMEELRYQKEAGIFSRKDGLVLYSEVRELPFLNAVIKEALRVHPAVGLMLERVVPSGGVTLHGQFIPEGTVVGANAWVLHRDKQIFGDQPEIWRPQRWLEASKEQKRIMENSLFSFGAGTRACTGRNISYLEMYKVVPALLMRFEVRLQDG